MRYKNKLQIILMIIALSFLALFFFLKNQDSKFCDQLESCLRILVYGAPYQYFFLPLASILLSIIPLFFLRESAYKAWQKFAVVGLPIVAVLIFLAPTTDPGDYIKLGYDREVASMLFSALFLLTSWGVILRAILKNKNY